LSWSELIDRLAALAGIEPWYYDLSGQWHETTQATKILVLNALGFDASSATAAEAGIRAFEEEPWRRCMTPFVVRRDMHDIDVFLPAGGVERNWEWEIVCEDGETAHGTFRPESLPLLGAREIDGHGIEHRRLALNLAVPPGYHRIRLSSVAPVESVLVCVPASCYVPPVLARPDRRVWGIATHLYTLRSHRNWGIGDFTDLAHLCDMTGQAGASAVAVNPFHALFPDRPEDASPYSPSSRHFLNPIYIDPEVAPFAETVAKARTPDTALVPFRASNAVEYSHVWREKQEVFELLFRRWQEQPAQAGPMRDFQRFIERGGPALERFATFAALAEEHGSDWHRWPVGLRAPGGEAIRAFAGLRHERILFHQYLQYLADGQLRAAAERARHSGLAVGIVRDLALGTNPDGADAWAQQENFVPLLRCGAPPDDFQSDGQEWGILPAHPLGLRRNPAPFAALLNANMRHAGGLRIDHVVGIQRQFLVPLGAKPQEGCYLRYPMDELFGLLALESWRNRCLIVGEDLGTVPEGFRDRMRETNIYGCALLYFERDRDGNFKAAHEYPVKAAASVATHDLPTLAGFWEGDDIAIRRRIGIYTDAQADQARARREDDCRRLVQLLVEADFLSADGARALPTLTASLRNAIHDFLASSAAQIFLAQLDDLSGETDQINLPGTTTSHANWRRKLSVALEDESLVSALRELTQMCEARGRHGQPD
jgi:(1->4)-alpha-D-glucan 1-alpha-D-glucosylmutase